MEEDDIQVELEQQVQRETGRSDLDRLRAEVRARRAAETSDTVPSSDESNEGRGVLETAGAVAGDVAGGVVETPGAILSGAIDAYNETVRLGVEAAKHLPLIGDPLKVLFPDGAPDAVPDVAPEQDTNTGKAIESIAQFAIGFAGAGKLKPIAGATTTGGRAVNAMVQGMVADVAVFDGHEQRLSNLVESNPALANPVTAFLAADDDDGEVEGRLKNAVEGAGAGLILDQFVRGLRVVRKARTAKAALEAADEADEAFRAKADADARAADEEIERILNGDRPAGTPDAPDSPGTPEDFLQNLVSKFDTSDGVRSTIRSLVDRDLPGIDQARRGTRNWSRTRSAAENIDAYERLKARNPGEALNAEELDAAYDLWLASTRRVMQAANLYQRGGRTDAGAYALSQVLEQHRLIQREVVGARAEAGRALNILRRKTKDGQDFMLELDDALTDVGGRGNLSEVAERISRLGPDQVKVLDEAIERSAGANTAEAFAEAWRFALLSNPKTHVVNAMSNTAVMAYDILERYAGGTLARIVGDDQSAELFGEAAQRAFGLRKAVSGQFRFFAENRRFNNEGVTAVRVDADSGAAFSARNLGLNADSPIGAGADAIGRVLRTPQELLGGADDFFKGVNYQAELYGQAHRRASSEVAAGRLPKEDLARRIAEMVDEPSDLMRDLARAAATDRTFTTPARRGGFTESILNIRRNANIMGVPFGHIVLPFITTPSNILKYNFRRTPAGLLMRSVQDRLSAGGREAYLARAQMGMGTSAIMLGADYAANGQMSGIGPGDYRERQALERQGWQRNAVRIGDTWVDHSRFDPFSAWLGLGASVNEIMVNAQEGEVEGDAAAVLTQTAGAMGNAMLSKTYLTGLSDLITLMQDPKRYGDNYVQRIVGAFVPAGVAEVRRLEDPAMRDVQSTLDAVRNRVPLLSDELPQSYDLWGRPRMYSSHLGAVYDGLSPFIVRKVDAEPIDAELSRLGYFPSLPDRSISVPTVEGTVAVSLRSRPDIYQRYVELSGNGGSVRRLQTFPGGRGAKDHLNALVQSPMYQRLADGSEPIPGSKAYEIQRVITLSKRVARAQVLREYGPELQEIARAERGRLEHEREEQESRAAAELLEAAASQ